MTTYIQKAFEHFGAGLWWQFGDGTDLWVCCASHKKWESFSMGSIDAVLFDIGGVLVKHDNGLLFKRSAASHHTASLSMIC
jgi:hypothetical protein